ncbi:MAG: trypsin-like peptidase domain-containing protein [Patescibacteria group bacterium]
MNNKKLLVFIIIAAIVGGFFGSLVSSRLAQANILDDLLNYLKGGAITTAPNPPAGGSPIKEIPLYKPTIDYEEAVIRSVETASPSVVSIVISKDLPVIENCGYDPFSNLPPEFKQFFGGNGGLPGQGFQFSQPCEKGTQKKEVGGGSGFIVSEEGLIATNKHVVYDKNADYTVLTNDGKKYDAKVLARDTTNDIALIKISATGLKAAIIGNSDSVKLGQTAIAIGNALGEFRNTVSVGVISGLSRTVTAGGGEFGSETIQGVFQTDAAINPGNSGGPLLNLKGEVIGINTAVVSGAQNIGFTIPINQVKRAIESVKKTGSIKTPYLGVRYLMIDEGLAKKQNLPVQNGALVRGTPDGPAIVPGSPAEKAGLKAEDIILEVNGEKINKEKTLSNIVQEYSIGDTLNLKVERGKDVITLSITLAERPTSE